MVHGRRESLHSLVMQIVFQVVVGYVEILKFSEGGKDHVDLTEVIVGEVDILKIIQGADAAVKVG